MFSTIVTGFDGSDQAHDALTLALALAGEETELVVACVYPDHLAGFAVAPEPDAAARAEAQQRLSAARRTLGGRTHVRFDARAAASRAGGLHDCCEAHGADLLVVGSSHRGAMGRVIPGSVTEQALHGAPCAVAVAPTDLRRSDDWRLRRVGVAFDGHPESHRALEAAAMVARESSATLEVIGVVKPYSEISGDWGGIYAAERKDEAVAQRAAERIDEAIAALEEAPAITRTVAEGRASEELLLATARLDLLVLGSRGYGPIRRLMLGTVAGRVMQTAACPVLVVPRGAELPHPDAHAETSTAPETA